MISFQYTKCRNETNNKQIITNIYMHIHTKFNTFAVNIVNTVETYSCR